MRPAVAKMQFLYENKAFGGKFWSIFPLEQNTSVIFLCSHIESTDIAFCFSNSMLPCNRIPIGQGMFSACF